MRRTVKTLPIKYSKPSECTSLRHWIYASWNIRAGWEGSYVMLREIGTRLFGFEFVTIKRRTAEE